MTTPRELWQRCDAPTRRRLALTTLAAVALGLAVLVPYWWGYNRLVQHPACYAYARERGLGDGQSLRVTSVHISRGWGGEHHCEFADRRTGEPVVLHFAPGDIPRVRDFLQLASMMVVVMAAVAKWGAGHVVDPRYHRSAEDALRRRSHRV